MNIENFRYILEFSKLILDISKILLIFLKEFQNYKSNVIFVIWNSKFNNLTDKKNIFFKFYVETYHKKRFSFRTEADMEGFIGPSRKEITGRMKFIFE